MKFFKKFFMIFIFIIFSTFSFGKNISFEGLKMNDINGQEYIFKSEKKTYVKLWASWCPVCRSGLDSLDELSKEEKDFDVVTVVFPNKGGEMSSEDFTKWYNELGHKNIKVLLDEEGEILKLIRVRAFPTSAFVNSQGKVEGVLVGELPKETVKEIMRDAVK